MDEIIIKGKFYVEGKEFKGVKQPLKYLKLTKTIPIPTISVDSFTSFEEEKPKENPALILASEPQMKYLRDLGIEIPEGLTKLEAGKILDEVNKKPKNDNPTPEPPKQETNDEFPDY